MNYERSPAAQALILLQQEEDLQLAFQEAKAKYQKSLRDGDLVRVDLNYVAIRAPIGGTVASVSTQGDRGRVIHGPFFVTITPSGGDGDDRHC